MSTPTMRQILADTQSLIQEKRAEYQSNLGEDEKQAKGLDISGAGDDSPKTRGHALEADESALEPTKKPLETGEDVLKTPPPDDGNGTPSQAKDPGGGDDSEMTRGHAMEADEACCEPTKKPLNGNEDVLKVKEASANLANDILGDIRAYQQKQAEDTGEAEKPAEDEQKAAEKPADEQDAEKPAEGEQKEAEEKAEGDVDIAAVLKEAGVELDEEKIAKIAQALTPKAAEKPAEGEQKEADETPAEGEQKEAAEGKAAEDQKSEADAGDKQAAGPNLELTTDVLAKIAAHILSTTEGAEYVEGFLAKEAGAEECREILGFLANQSELAEKQAAFEAGQADAAALYEQAIYQKGIEDGQKAASSCGSDKPAPMKSKEAKKTGGETAKDKGEKTAEEDFYTKLGQAVADASLAGLMGGAPGMDMGGDAVPPEALAGGEDTAAGDLAGEEEVSPEELMAALEELVAEGTIGEDEAAQVLEYISGGGDMGGAEAALAPGMEGGEEAPPAGGGEGDEGGAEEMPADDKEASDKAADLLAAIQSVRQQQSK